MSSGAPSCPQWCGLPAVPQRMGCGVFVYAHIPKSSACKQSNTRVPPASCNKLTTPRTRRSRRHHSCVPPEEARCSSWVEPRCRVVFRRRCTPPARRHQSPRQLERDPRFHSKRDAPSSPRVRPRVVYSGCWPVRNAAPGGPTNQRRSSCQRVQAGPIDHAARPSGQNGLGGVLSRGGAGLHPVLGPLQKGST